MNADFISLADALRPPQPPAPLAPVVAPAAEADDDHDAPVSEPRPTVDVAAALRAVRVSGARAADAFDAAAVTLLRDLAADVLARELRLAPCDLERIVQRIAARVPFLRVRVAPEDGALVTGIATVVDPELTAGDAIVEVAGGALDARLGVRLAVVLEAFA